MIDQVERINCLNSAGVIFFVVGLITSLLFALWIAKTYNLTAWKTILVMVGQKHIVRSFKMNVFHFLAIAVPFGALLPIVLKC